MTDGLFAVPEDGVLMVLWRVPGWPKDVEKDERLVAQMARERGDLNLMVEARKFHEWMVKNKPKGRVNHRARFRTWCRRVGERRQGDRADQRAPVTQPAEDRPDAGWAKSVGDRVPVADGWD